MSSAMRCSDLRSASCSVSLHGNGEMSGPQPPALCHAENASSTTRVRSGSVSRSTTTDTSASENVSASPRAREPNKRSDRRRGPNSIPGGADTHRAHFSDLQTTAVRTRRQSSSHAAGLRDWRGFYPYGFYLYGFLSARSVRLQADLKKSGSSRTPHTRTVIIW
jgi:hypothetical protein